VGVGVGVGVEDEDGGCYVSRGAARARYCATLRVPRSSSISLFLFLLFLRLVVLVVFVCGASASRSMEFSLEQSWVDTVDIHQTCPLPSWASSAHVGSIEQYRAMYRESIEEPEAFWGRLAAEFHWQQPWSEVEAHHYDCSTGNVFVRWFSGGRTNLCYNALDRHVAAGHGDTVAYFWYARLPAIAIAIGFGIGRNLRSHSL